MFLFEKRCTNLDQSERTQKNESEIEINALHKIKKQQNRLLLTTKTRNREQKQKSIVLDDSVDKYTEQQGTRSYKDSSQQTNTSTYGLLSRLNKAMRHYMSLSFVISYKKSINIIVYNVVDFIISSKKRSNK